MSDQDSNFAMTLSSWFREHGTSSAEDLICCLPKTLRDNYVVAHSSLSAQSSHYHNPRVILFDLAKSIFISVSGGDPDFPQSSNIEIMQKPSSAMKFATSLCKCLGKP